MFRIKKDDYNTVQFLPDSQTSRSSRRKQKDINSVRVVERPAPKIRKLKVKGSLFVWIIVLLAVLLLSRLVYIRFFTDEAQYLRLFQQGQYEQCLAIAENNADDAAFKEEIEKMVIGSVDGLMSSYLAREVTAEETQNLLSEYDQASAQLFHQYIGDNQHWITTVESIYAKVDEAENEAHLGYYVESVTTLQQVAEEAGKNGLNFQQRITQILRDNLNGYKSQLFVSFANTIRNSSDYTLVTDTVAFVNQYIKDDDFTAFPDVVDKVQNGEYSKLTAARMARQIAKNAGADIEVNEGSGASPSAKSTSSGSNSSGKSSSSSSKKKSSSSNSGNSEDTSSSDSKKENSNT